MKTAISIPDQVYKKAEMLARKLGMNRSELYVKAISEFIKESDDENITNKLNSVYSEQSSSIDKEIYNMQYKTIHKGNNW